ncbi:hypothetical protein [Burkholderia sp. Ac-20365]|uniref:hypothetical protein n=1 Tax=Burkholderia sp. Ac-20365 TaxID=2703897 RepID=UPI00197C4CE8|nr:hypothetical protein [Burkholderia sp. Ac-20365]MBN3762453.1 hypothetical protein [Burkholderia sp. Ac-20365]
MFTLQHHPVKITHLNVRSESHGDQERTAIDIKLTFDLPCEALDSMSPQLRTSLYLLDGRKPPALKHPRLGPLRWTGEYKHVSLHLHACDLLSDDVVIGDTRFCKIVASPREGGTCAFTCQVQAHPQEDDAGKLLMLLKRQVPATVDALDENDGTEAHQS